MRVLAINDISCVGKCSLTVSLPIISACGITCDVLPTALLSTHTGGFDGYTFLDLSTELEKITAHWKTLGIRFDYVYSGYLGNETQIDAVAEIKKQFLAPGGKFIVDPVMGDGGKLYAGFSPSYIQKMKTLCAQADYILPNLTEACALADIPYPAQGQAAALIENLKSICPRPIVTGILEEKDIAVYYTDEQDKVKRYASNNVEGFFCGAGDVFASAFVGALAYGKTEEVALRLAADFTSAAIRRSANSVPDKRYGLDFEQEIFTFLKNLHA